MIVHLPWILSLMLIAGALGALVMYAYDPDLGARRRGRAAVQARRSGQALTQAMEAAGRDMARLAGRGHGADRSDDAWPANFRLLAAVAGILFLVMWLGWAGFVMAVLGVIGAGLLIRALTNRELKRVFGLRDLK